MKKLLALALTGALALSAFGQGRFSYSSRTGIPRPGLTRLFTGRTGGGWADGADPLLRAALLGGPTSATPVTSRVSGWTTLSMTASPDNPDLTWVGFRTGPAAGYVNVGSNAARVIPFVNWGQQALVQVVGWRGDYDTYQEAVRGNAPVGFSAPLTVTLPAGPTDPNLAKLVGLQSFTIGIIPEPSTFALAGFGAAALLLGRGCALARSMSYTLLPLGPSLRCVSQFS